MLVNLLLKPPGLVKTGKHSGILSVESRKWGVRKGNLFLYIPSPDSLVGKEQLHPAALFVCQL